MDKILILDFGSQYTQLIARRIRELRVYSEIVPYTTPFKAIQSHAPSGVILSGGPSSVYDPDPPLCDPQVMRGGFPVLGICYGMQLMTHLLGGRVARSEKREYGRAELSVKKTSDLFDKVLHKTPVWMSHGDRIDLLPPGFTAIAKTHHSPAAAMQDRKQMLYGLQFHPEVAHTPEGVKILKNFVFQICGCKPTWDMGSYRVEAEQKIASEIREGRAVCAVSGGVDSSVAAALVQRVMGPRLTCFFVNNGLLRKNEERQVLDLFSKNLKLNVKYIDASHRFLTALNRVYDPEKKRKIIGREFIAVFEEEARKIGKVDFLVQGTLYPDVIESVSVKGPSATIKSHHNVGGLPKRMKFKLVEPLRNLFKDEVRELGRTLNIPGEILERHPFPGPGLAVRILGKITAERLDRLRSADAIFEEEMRKAGLYASVWQSFAIYLPVRSVGVMGDERTYQDAIALRAVVSQDGMTADWFNLPHDLLRAVSTRIVNEVEGINRVVYDVSSKPPSTIEWE